MWSSKIEHRNMINQVLMHQTDDFIIEFEELNILKYL